MSRFARTRRATTVSSAGISVAAPQGWEAEIYPRDDTRPADALNTADAGSPAQHVLHVANFALPAERGDFGSGAVELMAGGGILLVLFEYGAESLGTTLFAAEGIPQLDPESFHPSQMQRTLPGQAGRQVFFTEAGRPFCLYAVLGSYRRRDVLVREINTVLADLEIAPRS